MKERQNFGKRARMAHLKLAIGRTHFDSAVEFGCMEGHLLHSLNANKKTGYDICPFEEFDDIQYIKADVLDISLSNNDIVLCSEVVEHIHDDVGVIRKIHSSLKKEGYVFLTTLNRNTESDKSEIDKARGHLRRYGPELKDLMEKIGFSTIKFYPFRGRHYYDCKKGFEEYDPEKDIEDSERFASGWVYFGTKK